MRRCMTIFPQFVVFLCALSAASACSVAISPLEIEAAQTAARVKTALVNDALVGPRVIDVRVSGGIARLSGRVATQEEAARAVEVARGVPGVSQVDSRLQIGGEPAPDPALETERSDPRSSPAYEFAELEAPPGNFAVGAALGFNNQEGREAGARVTLSPQVRVGSSAGLGPAIAFDWFDAIPLAAPDAATNVGSVRVRPVMGGVRYTLPVGRLSIAPSLVAGYAFNSLRVPDEGAVEQLAVGVTNSFAWRPGVSFWVESSRRTAVHLSIGRVFTSPRFSVVEDGRLRQRTLSADTTVFLVGMAYKVF